MSRVRTWKTLMAAVPHTDTPVVPDLGAKLDSARFSPYRAEEPNCFCGTHETTAPVIVAKDPISGESFTYVTCAACGAQRLSPRPCAEAIGAYYPDDYQWHSIRPDSRSRRIKHLIYLAYYASENRLGL